MRAHSRFRFSGPGGIREIPANRFCRDRGRCPLVGGLWDQFEAAGIRALGPSRAAAVLEGSKGFVKDLCAEIGIPTAAYRRFRDPVAAKSFADRIGFPVVIKADGLAAGKGVIVATSKSESDRAIDFMFEVGFGELAGLSVSGDREIVVEEFMEGEEVSLFRPQRWQECHSAGGGAGSQARRRRRYRSQYRWHGRLQSGTRVDAGAGNPGDGYIRPSHRRRVRTQGSRLYGCPLSRA